MCLEFPLHPFSRSGLYIFGYNDKNMKS